MIFHAKNCESVEILNQSITQISVKSLYCHVLLGRESMNVIEELNPPVSNTSLQVRSKKAIDDILIRRKSIEEKPFYLKKGHSLHKERGKEGLSIFI